MRFRSDSLEYLRIPITAIDPATREPIDLSTATVRVKIGGAEWVEAEPWPGGRWAVFIAGPDVDDPPAEALVIPAGTHTVLVQIIDDPEQPVRRAPEALIVS